MTSATTCTSGCTLHPCPSCCPQSTCNGIVGAAAPVAGKHSPEAERHYRSAQDAVRGVKNGSSSDLEAVTS